MERIFGERRGKGGGAGRKRLVDGVQQDVGIVCGDEATCRKRVLAVDRPRAFLGLLRAGGANLFDYDAAFEQFVAIATKPALIRVDVARAIPQIGIQDDLLGRQRLGRAVEYKEKIEDTLGRFIELGSGVPFLFVAVVSLAVIESSHGKVVCCHDFSPIWRLGYILVRSGR